MKKNVPRLYKQFVPEHYALHLSIDEPNMTFTGKVVIKGKKHGRPTKRITLHQKGLKITSAEITHHDKTGHVQKELARINKHGKLDEVRLHTHETLYPGAYSVEVTFSGVITRNMDGMYPCTFEYEGKPDQLIATQFESHHAREVFPCIDEPEAKAVFELSLETRTGITVLSNTPQASQKEEFERLTTTFEPTPKMSTYLLAFVIGNMGYKEGHSKSGITVRTYATPDNVQFTDFALETAVRCIDYYEDYFGIDYPLAKCDLIALPDFASGAMENWGCITFREQCMLVDPENTSLPTKQFVGMVVAHELAHMWFGNLVTMRWWEDLWLNEGFATWIEYMAVDVLFPEWQMWTQFVTDEQQQALKLDSLENTHPIEVPVAHPDEIRTIFDAISYSKGASVIHQLHAYIGDKAFKEGLKLYLTRHAYANTSTQDLWQALSEASGKDVKKFMHAWTSEPGYPIVHVSEKNGKLHLTQKRFTMVNAEPSKRATSWHIPLLDSHVGETAILAAMDTSIVLPDDQPMYFNKQRSGFYRVSYEHTLLMQLAELVDQGKLEPLDRLGLLADLFEASKSGDVSTVTALEFLSHYSKEENAVVWTIIAGMIGSIRLIHGSDELREAIKPYILRLALPEYKRLGWDKKPSDSYFDQLLRPTILGLLASADEPEIIKKCQDIFRASTETDDVDPELRISGSHVSVKRGIDIDPDMRGVVFGTVARLGNQSTYNKLIHLHKTTHLSEEQLTLSAALTNFRQPEIIDQSLAYIRSEHVRLQDVAYWLAYSFLNHFARERTWKWMKDNWDWLHQNLGSDLSFFRMPIYSARVHSDSRFINSFREFFEPRMTPALERSYKQGLEMLEWQSAWRDRDYEAILKYFKEQQ